MLDGRAAESLELLDEVLLVPLDFLVSLMLNFGEEGDILDCVAVFVEKALTMLTDLLNDLVLHIPEVRSRVTRLGAWRVRVNNDARRHSGQRLGLPGRTRILLLPRTWLRLYCRQA